MSEITPDLILLLGRGREILKAGARALHFAVHANEQRAVAENEIGHVVAGLALLRRAGANVERKLFGF